jgi:hypothetical protein
LLCQQQPLNYNQLKTELKQTAFVSLLTTLYNNQCIYFEDE